MGSRARLQGSIAKAAGPTYFLIPDVVSNHTSRSRQISISDDGNPASASDKTETALQALNIDNVIYGILRTVGGSGELPMTVGGTPAGPAVSFSPIVGSPFDPLSVTIGLGAPQTTSIEQAVGLIGGSWIPWAGSLGAPPAIPVRTGIATLIAADATLIDAAAFFGPAGSPDNAMRSTLLGIALSGTSTPHRVAQSARTADRPQGREARRRHRLQLSRSIPANALALRSRGAGRIALIARARTQLTALTGATLAAAIVFIFISLHLGHCSRPRLERCILHPAVRRALISPPSQARDARLRLQLQLSLSSSRPLLSPSA